MLISSGFSALPCHIASRKPERKLHLPPLPGRTSGLKQIMKKHRFWLPGGWLVENQWSQRQRDIWQPSIMQSLFWSGISLLLLAPCQTPPDEDICAMPTVSALLWWLLEYQGTGKILCRFSALLLPHLSGWLRKESVGRQRLPADPETPAMQNIFPGQFLQKRS